MKYVYLFLALMFVLFAALQYNDHDPYLWVPYYLAIALICYFKFKSRKYNWLLYTMLVITVGWLISYIPDVISYIKVGEPNLVSEMKASTPYIENMREFGGLAIGLITILSVVRKKK